MKIFSSVAAAVTLVAFSAVGFAAPAFAAPTVVSPFDMSSATNLDPDYNYASVTADGTVIAVIPEDGCVANIVTVADGTWRTIDLDCDSAEHGHAVFSPDGSLLYVPNYTAETIEVYDLSNDTKVREISGIPEAWTLEISPDGQTLFALGYNTRDLFKVDLGTDTVSAALANVGEAASMCISADGSTLFVPDYEDNLSVIDVADWNWTDQDERIFIGETVRPYSCEWDNDGNMIVNAFEYNQVAKVAMPSETVTISEEDVASALYAVIPSCDAIYLGDDNNSNIRIANISTLALEDETVLPSDSTTGDGWYAYYGGDRSADGSVIAMGGYYGTDALAIIKSEECAPTTPELPNTGVDTTAAAAGAFGLLALFAGVFVLVARRRKG
jgi:LPXTG-motif cell wall-anchored protein